MSDRDIEASAPLDAGPPDDDTTTNPPPRTGPVVWLAAWGVHLYTAMGLVLAAAVAVLLVRGRPEDFRWSFALMAVAYDKKVMDEPV